MIKTATLGESCSALEAAPAAHSDSTGDRITAMFHSHLDLVWRTAHRFGLNVAEADDAAQHVFIVAAKKIATIAEDEERRFLLATAINVARTMVRSRQRRREDFIDAPEAPDPASDPERSLDRERAKDSVQRILQAMPDDVRVPFALFEMEELTMIEIATVLGIPQGTVASRIRRGREIFRDRARAFVSAGDPS